MAKPPKSGTIARAMYDLMVTHPGREFTRADMALLLNPPDGYSGDWQKTIGQALNQQAGRGAIGRVDYGVYVFPPDLAPPFEKSGLPGRRPGQAPRVQAATDDLAPLTEHIDDDAFKAVGLRPIATAADGARICTDDQGTVWKVTVRVEARLV